MQLRISGAALFGDTSHEKHNGPSVQSRKTIWIIGNRLKLKCYIQAKKSTTWLRGLRKLMEIIKLIKSEKQI